MCIRDRRSIVEKQKTTGVRVGVGGQGAWVSGVPGLGRGRRGGGERGCRLPFLATVWGVVFSLHAAGDRQGEIIPLAGLPVQTVGLSLVSSKPKLVKTRRKERMETVPTWSKWRA